MTRDARVWLPAAVGLALCAPHALPRAEAPLPPATSVALPPLRGAPTLPGPERFTLVASRSTVRIAFRSDDGVLVADCPDVRGELLLGDGTAGVASAGTLELRLDLASLTAGSGSPRVDLHDLLGVRRAEHGVFRGVLAAETCTDLPGVRRLTFDGTLSFGGRVLRQEVRLWWCSLPGSQPRLQGHGSLAAELLGLPTRHRFGLFAEPRTVTLGFDLAWRRHRDD